MTKDLRHHELITNLQAIKHQLKDLTDAIVSLGHAYQLPQTTLPPQPRHSARSAEQPHGLAKYLPPDPPKPWYWEQTTYPAPTDDSAD